MPESEETILIKETSPEEDDEQLPGCPGWMVTFGDAISLLLTFFVLLLAFSDPNIEAVNKFLILSKEKKDFFRIADNLKENVVRVNASDFSGSAAGIKANRDTKDIERQIDAQALEMQSDNKYALNMSYEEINTFTSHTQGMAEQEGEKEAAIEVEQDTGGNNLGFRVKLAQNFAFALGTAYLRQQSKEYLNKIGRFISDLPNDIIISCSSNDYNRIAFPAFPSNGHLSIERAYTIASIFINVWHVDAHRIGIKVLDLPSEAMDKGITEKTAEAQVQIEVLSTFDGYKRSEMEKVLLEKQHKGTDGTR